MADLHLTFRKADAANTLLCEAVAKRRMAVGAFTATAALLTLGAAAYKHNLSVEPSRIKDAIGTVSLDAVTAVSMGLALMTFYGAHKLWRESKDMFRKAGGAPEKNAAAPRCDHL